MDDDGDTPTDDDDTGSNTMDDDGDSGGNEEEDDSAPDEGGGDDTGGDTIDGGGDSGDDTGSDTMDDDGDSGGDDKPDSDGEDNDNADNSEENPIQQMEDEIFKDLSDSQKQIRDYEMKSNYIKLHDSINDILQRLNNVYKTDENIRIVDFVTKQLISLKDMVKDYLTKTYITKTFQENMLFYQHCLVIMSDLNRLIIEILPDLDGNKPVC